MTTKTTVIDILDTLGRVTESAGAEGRPITFRPATYPSPEGPTGAIIHVNLEERSGVQCVTFSARVDDFCEDMDVVRFRRDADHWSSMTKFGKVLVMGYDMASTGIGEGRIEVRHTLVTDEVSRDAVKAVISDVVGLWQKSRGRCLSLKMRQRSESHRRKIREQRQEAIRQEAAEPRRQLESLVGLAPVKEVVHEQVALHRLYARRTAEGLGTSSISPNLVFTGNPGTGKTTVGKIVAGIYRELGLVSKGHLVVAERADLVANYVGQTATKTRNLCRKAKGGVLFIDEAYSLAPRHGRNDYGREAIETLITYMEENRDDFAVIVAGYPSEMRMFIGSNPGLASRFDRTVEFPDYSDLELMEILGLMMREEDWEFAEGARHKAFSVVKSMARGRGFGNAREIRRLFAVLKSRQAVLLAERTDLTRDDLRFVTMEAVPGPMPAITEVATGPRDHPGYL